MPEFFWPVFPFAGPGSIVTLTPDLAFPLVLLFSSRNGADPIPIFMVTPLR